MGCSGSTSGSSGPAVPVPVDMLFQHLTVTAETEGAVLVDPQQPPMSCGRLAVLVGSKPSLTKSCLTSLDSPGPPSRLHPEGREVFTARVCPQVLGKMGISRQGIFCLISVFPTCFPTLPLPQSVTLPGVDRVS